MKRNKMSQVMKDIHNAEKYPIKGEKKIGVFYTIADLLATIVFVIGLVAVGEVQFRFR